MRPTTPARRRGLFAALVFTTLLTGCLIEDCGNDWNEGDGAGIYNHAGHLTVRPRRGKP